VPRRPAVDQHALRVPAEASARVETDPVAADGAGGARGQMDADAEPRDPERRHLALPAGQVESGDRVPGLVVDPDQRASGEAGLALPVDRDRCRELREGAARDRDRVRPCARMLKRIVSASGVAFAAWIAARNESGPASFVFLTTNVALPDATAEGSAASASAGASRRAQRLFTVPPLTGSSCTSRRPSCRSP